MTASKASKPKKKRRSHVEVYVSGLTSLRRWRLHAGQAIKVGEAPRIALSLIATGYLVTTPERAKEVDDWALSLPGYWHRAPDGRDVPALEIKADAG